MSVRELGYDGGPFRKEGTGIHANNNEWPAFVGIDWGGSHHQVCVVDSSGRRRSSLWVTHAVAALTDLDAELARHGDRAAIALERWEGLLVEHLAPRWPARFAPPMPSSR